MTTTKTRPIGNRRYDWEHDGMRESEDGNYLLATDLRLSAPQLLEACKAAYRVIGEAAYPSGYPQPAIANALELLHSAIAKAEGRE